MTLQFDEIPSEKQKAFFRSDAKFTAYGGARGGGKSWALRRKLILLMLRYPGIRCLLVRRSLGELKGNHLFPILREYGKILTYKETDSTATMKNGSTLMLGYCANQRDTLRYQGMEFDIIAIDEATQLTEEMFRIFTACLRGINDYPKRMYLTCNPGGVGHAWVKRLFVDRRYRAGENPDDYRFIPAKLSDNPVLQKANPDYENTLKALPDKLRRAWLDGDWNVFDGQFFPELATDSHLISYEKIPRNLTYFLSFDYGLDMLFALLLGVDAEGNLYVLSECHELGLTLRQAGEKAAKLGEGYPVSYAVCSPDLWNRRQDTGYSGFEIMQSVPGMPSMKKADDRRVPGWRMVREYLSEGTPSLYFTESVPELRSNLENLLFDKINPEDASSQPHAVTHGPEALRYAVMSRALPPTEQPMFSFRTAPNAFDWW